MTKLRIYFMVMGASLFILLLSGCAIEVQKPQIEPVIPSFIVKITSEEAQDTCTATILNEDYLFTAAHCDYYAKWAYTTNGEWVKIGERVYFDLAEDLAIYKIDTPVGDIDFPVLSSKEHPGYGTVTLFGSCPRFMMAVARFGHFTATALPNEHIGVDHHTWSLMSCIGDSGGPLLDGETVIGVVLTSDQQGWTGTLPSVRVIEAFKSIGVEVTVN